MKLLLALLSVLPVVSSAWMTMSIAQGNPIRRSVVKYTDDPVPAEAITAAVEAAMLAPNHFMTEPTRMYDLGPEAVGKLKELNEAKAKMFSGVPGWMLVTIKSENLDDDGNFYTKLGLEDHATVACAVQNFMQSLAEDGIGTKWMTGALGIDPAEILKVAGVPEGEFMVGMIWYGKPATEISELKVPKRKLAVDDILTKVP